MSSSSAQAEASYTGRVFMGVETPGPNEMSIQELEGKRKLVWDKNTDEEYSRRVKERAVAKAREVIAQAMREADELRAKAHEEAYEAGMRAAQADAQAQLDAMAAQASSLFAAIEARGDDVWNDMRQDMVALVHKVIEKTLGIEMETRRGEILESLLHQALNRLESFRQLRVRVAPQDAELAGHLLGQAQNDHPELSRWKIVPDQTLAQHGGVILETTDSRADNAVEGRWSAIAPILEQLHIPTPQAEPAAASQAEAKPEPAAEAATEPKAEPQPEPAAEAAPESEAETEPTTEAAPETEAEPETEAAPAAETESSPEADAKAEAEPEPEAEPEAEPSAEPEGDHGA